MAKGQAPALAEVKDPVILMLSNPVAGGRDDPSALPEGNQRLGLVNLVHDPAHRMFPKKRHHNGLTFLQCDLLRRIARAPIKNNLGQSAVQFRTLVQELGQARANKSDGGRPGKSSHAGDRAFEIP
jgi:hypothetical protein